jgi:tripartite-type tricarboxylate transporter receptor subunit TctC
VIVENRAGASGAIAAHGVATAAPDGLMLLIGQTAEVAINQHWLKGLTYDPDKDLKPVALLAVVPLALTVPGKAPYSTMAEFLKALPGQKMTFASAGTGTPGHFAGEFLKAKTKANLVHVPYKGAGPALNDLLGSHVDMYFPGMPAVMPHAKSGTLKVLAVSSAKRSAIAPEVPTIAETTGMTDFDFTLWAGVFAPRETPPAVITKLNAEINKVLSDPDTKKRLVEAGAEVDTMSVAQFRAFVDGESSKYQRIIKETGVTAE